MFGIGRGERFRKFTGIDTHEITYICDICLLSLRTYDWSDRTAMKFAVSK